MLGTGNNRHDITRTNILEHIATFTQLDQCSSVYTNLSLRILCKDVILCCIHTNNQCICSILAHKVVCSIVVCGVGHRKTATRPYALSVHRSIGILREAERYARNLNSVRLLFALGCDSPATVAIAVCSILITCKESVPANLNRRCCSLCDIHIRRTINELGMWVGEGNTQASRTLSLGIIGCNIERKLLAHHLHVANPILISLVLYLVEHNVLVEVVRDVRIERKEVGCGLLLDNHIAIIGTEAEYDICTILHNHNTLCFALAVNKYKSAANSIAVNLIGEGDITVALAASVRQGCPVEFILQLSSPSAIRIYRNTSRALAILLEFNAMLLGIIVVYAETFPLELAITARKESQNRYDRS